MVALAYSVPAGADGFGDFSDAFSKRVGDGFGVSLVDTSKRRAAFARREYFAHVSNKVLALAQLRLHASVQGESLSLETMRSILHTGHWDCSVNHVCWSCDGKKWWQRGPCEVGRAACAAAQAPRLAVCAAGKALDGTELGHIDFSGALLNVDGDVHEFNLMLDESLATLHAAPKIGLSASVQNLNAAVHLNVIAGVFAGCPLPPTIHVPKIGVSLTNVTVPVSGAIVVDSAAGATDGLRLSISLDAVHVKGKVDTGDIFDWIKANPTAIIFCPLPSIAAFTYATTVSEHEFTFMKDAVKVKVSSFKLKRNSQPLVVNPKLTPQAIGVIEAQPATAAIEINLAQGTR